MVFCFLPGTRPASVMSCMTSACHVTENAGLDLRVRYCVSGHCYWNAYVFDFVDSFNVFILVWNVCWVSSACPLLHLHCPGPALCLPFLLTFWLSETQRVPFAVAASVPPTTVGRLQIHPHRLRVLLHIQHQRLPHWLWNPVPAGELQLQDGSHAGYGFRKGPVKTQMHHLSHVTVTFSSWTGTSTVCTPEQYKDCADPALGEHLYCRTKKGWHKI